MKVTVQTIDQPSGLATIHSLIKQIEWTNSSDRRWLTNHLHWAMNNDKEVRLSATKANPMTTGLIMIDETRL